MIYIKKLASSLDEVDNPEDSSRWNKETIVTALTFHTNPQPRGLIFGTVEKRPVFEACTARLQTRPIAQKAQQIAAAMKVAR